MFPILMGSPCSQSSARSRDTCTGQVYWTSGERHGGGVGPDTPCPPRCAATARKLHARRPTATGPCPPPDDGRSPHPHPSPVDRQRVQVFRHTAGCCGPSGSLTSTSSSASRLGPSIITARV